MKVKETFLLCGAIFFFVLMGCQPLPIMRKGTGMPFEKQWLARAGLIGIGLVTLLLWYSLPPG